MNVVFGHYHCKYSYPIYLTALFFGAVIITITLIFPKILTLPFAGVTPLQQCTF